MKLLLKHSSLFLCLTLLLSSHASAQEFTKIKQHTNLNIDEFISKIESGGDFSSIKVGLSDTLRIGSLVLPTSIAPYLSFDISGTPLFFDPIITNDYRILALNSSENGLLTSWLGTSWRGINYPSSQVGFGIVLKEDTGGTTFKLQRNINQDTLQPTVKARYKNTFYLEDISKPQLSFSGCPDVSAFSALHKSSLIQSDTNGVFLCARQLWRPLRTSSGCLNTKVAVNASRIAIGMTYQGDVLLLDKDTFKTGYPLCSRILAILDNEMNAIRTIKFTNVTHIIDLSVDQEGYTYCQLFIDATSCSSTSFEIDGETIPAANQTTPNSKSIVAMRFKPDGSRDWMRVLDAGSQGWPNLAGNYPFMTGSYDKHFTSYLYVRNVTNANLEPLGSKKQVFYAIDRTGEKLVWDSVSSVASGYEMMSLIGLDSSVQIFDLTNGKQQFGSEVFPQRTVQGTRNLNIVNWQPFFNLKSSRESISYSKAYQVVPNPSKGSFQIIGLSGIAQVELWSLDGRLIEALNYSPGAEVSSLEHLSSGVYLLKITEDFKTSTLKIVKQ